MSVPEKRTDKMVIANNHSVKYIDRNVFIHKKE